MENIKISLWKQSMQFFHKYWGCHQMPSRSYFVFGYQFPLCARCMGILFGEILVCVLVLFDKSLDLLYALGLIMPTAIDGILQLKGFYESNNIRRLVTGVIAGIGIGYIIYDLLLWILILCGG